jgi:hypothetical protein
MARGRMLDKRFTASKKLNAIPREYRYMYAAILPHLDREGRINAQPIYLKANVFLNTDVQIEEIAPALVAMESVGLIDLYGGDDHAAVLAFIGFETFNTPNKREAKSELPPPTGKDVTDTLILDARHLHVQSTDNAGADAVLKLNVNDNVNENENGKATSATPPTPIHESSEERFHNRRHGTANDKHRVRATIRRIHADFARRNEDSMDAWSRWTDEQIHEFWELSDPNKWPDGNQKKRSWIFADLLNEDRQKPIVLPPRETEEEWYKRHGLEHIWEMTNEKSN